MSEKRKRGLTETKPVEKLIVLLAAIIPALLACLLLVIFQDDEPESSGAAATDSPTAVPTPVIQETLTVPFDDDSPTLTTRQYRGRVRLFIEGTGQAAGNAYSDAFYLYTDDAGRPLAEPQTEMFDLEIDGQRAIIALGLQDDPPPFDPENHLYAVIYDVEDDPRQIAFRIADYSVGDNSGAFTITVVQLD